MAKQITTTKPVTKPAQVVAPTIKAKPVTLHYHAFTPSGRMLRAYFIAMIMAQTGGKLTIGACFRLWPSANIRGHLDTKKVIRKDGQYALSTSGYNYFTDPEQVADKDQCAAFLKAIKTGKPTAFYKHPMQVMK